MNEKEARNLRAIEREREPLLIAVRDYEDPEKDNEKEISLNEYSQKLNERLKRIFCNKYRFNELKEKFNKLAENFGEISSDDNNTLIYYNNLLIENLIETCEYHWLYFNKPPGDFAEYYYLKTPEDEKNFAEDIARALENLDKITA